ncbi:MAG: hypothetical protein ACRD2W_04675 [Acidimicrobiales bacterium]
MVVAVTRRVVDVVAGGRVVVGDTGVVEVVVFWFGSGADVVGAAVVGASEEVVLVPPMASTDRNSESGEVEEGGRGHARRGDRTWVAMTVAIELAASWKPLV